VISGVSINDKRKQSCDFTPPYFAARQLIARRSLVLTTMLRRLEHRLAPSDRG
jgi:polar amino acid transport system substrate-binding protein